MTNKNKQNLIKAPGKLDVMDSHKVNELLKCIDDPIYFTENYVKVQHPKHGAINLKLYPYQRDIISCFHKHRYGVFLTARQMGKTTCAASYILWKAMFNPDQLILVAANKHASALEIMHRISYTYEELPSWLKDSVVTYNKGNIDFANGSRIISATTTPDTGRGLAISLLYLDEFAFVKPRIAEEFWTSIQPTLSEGGSCIITSTPNSDEDQFAHIYNAATQIEDEYGIAREDGLGKNNFKAMVVTWDKHPNRNIQWRDEQLSKIGEAKFKREFNCEFIQQDETLINGIILSSMSAYGVDPLIIEEFTKVRWYSKPEPGKIYLIGLDPSIGTGRDNAAIQVFQLPDMIQVAEWKNNETSVKDQIKILLGILKTLDSSIRQGGSSVSEIYWTVENNSVGEAALVVISDTGEDRFPGTFIHEPRKPGHIRRKGLTTTNKTKISACSRLKSLIESKRIIIKSKPLISELKNYVRSGVGFSSKYGSTDDLISSTLLCIRLMQIQSHSDPDFNDALREAIDNEESDNRDPMPISILI